MAKLKKKKASSSRFLFRSVSKLIRMPTARDVRCPELVSLIKRR